MKSGMKQPAVNLKKTYTVVIHIKVNGY